MNIADGIPIFDSDVIGRYSGLTDTDNLIYLSRDIFGTINAM